MTFGLTIAVTIAFCSGRDRIYAEAAPAGAVTLRGVEGLEAEAASESAEGTEAVATLEAAILESNGALEAEESVLPQEGPDEQPSGNVDQGGIHHLFDEGSVLVEQDTSPEESAETPEPAADEVTGTGQGISRRSLILPGSFAIAVAIIIYIGYAVYKKTKKQK